MFVSQHSLKVDDVKINIYISNCFARELCYAV